MATYKERNRANGVTAWEADIRVPGMRRISATFPTKAEAVSFVATHEPQLRKASRAAARESLAAPVEIAANKTEAKIKVVQATAPEPNIDFYDLDLKSTILEYVATYDPNATEVGEKERKNAKCTLRNRTQAPGAIQRLDSVTIGGADEFWMEGYIDALREPQPESGKPLAYATILNHIIVFKAACVWKARKMKIRSPNLYFTSESFPEGWEVKRNRRLEPGEHDLILAAIKSYGEETRSKHRRLVYEMCLETAGRLQELVFAQWSEFEDDGMWNIPAEHTKKTTDRFVPLSARARAILEELRGMKDPSSSRVFHRLKNPGVVSNAFTEIFKRAGITGCGGQVISDTTIGSCAAIFRS